MKKLLFLMFSLGISFPCTKQSTQTSTQQNLILKSNFEEPNALSKWQSETAYPNSIERSPSPKKANNFCAKFTIKKLDPSLSIGYRAELKDNEMPINSERWYGLSVFLPESYSIDPIPESFIQWHNMPNFKRGETWGRYKFQNPFRIETRNGRFYFVHQFSSIPADANSTIASKSYDLGPYKTESWTDWVIHFKLSYKSDGLFEIWKDGKKALALSGPNYYNDDSGPYLKLGLYKWGFLESSLNERILYIDDIRVGNQHSNYKQVAPN